MGILDHLTCLLRNLYTGQETEAEAPILWPPDVKSQLIRKDPDTGEDWRQEEKGLAEDKIVGWCREPAWGIPHGKGHEERGLTNTKVGSGLRDPPGLSWASTPKTRVCLLYCVMLSTNSSDINRGLSHHHLFLEKVNLELLDNKSPGHNKSVSIQKPLWWLSSLPARLLQLRMCLFVASRPWEAQEA